MSAAPRPASALPLAHPDPGVREAAARALVARGGPEVAAAVVPLVAHSDLAVRSLAGDVLARLGAAAVGALRPALADADPDVRKFAVDLLARLPAGPLAPEIAALLEDPDANVRLAAVDALAALGAGPYVDRLIGRYRAEPLMRPNVLAALGACGTPAATALVLDALTDPDGLVRLAAVDALAGLDVDALPLFERALARVDGPARAVVLDALVRWADGHPDAALPGDVEGDLLAMLDDPDPAYRQSAARGLRRVGGGLDTGRLLAHAGRDGALDGALFGVLVAQDRPFAALVAAPSTPAGPAASFAAALLAHGAVPPASLGAAGRFLAERFGALDADAKMDVAALCARLGHPELEGVLDAALADPAPCVAEAARAAAGLPVPTGP